MSGPDRQRYFESTDWSVINQLRGPDAESALANLCRQYWYPLYSYARSRSRDIHHAQDLTQGFFVQLIEKRSLRQAAEDRGRFRSFLLTAFKNFIANEYVRDNAQQRGGGKTVVSLDFVDGERQFERAAISHMSPERIYERSWTLTLMDCVLNRLSDEFRNDGQQERFALLSPALLPHDCDLDFGAVAQVLKISEVAARQAASRLRRRYRELLKAEVSRTLADVADVDDEIDRMFQSFAGDVS